MIYLQLFLSFLQIGMFSFGGGYAAMPLIQGLTRMVSVESIERLMVWLAIRRR